MVFLLLIFMALVVAACLYAPNGPITWILTRVGRGLARCRVPRPAIDHLELGHLPPRVEVAVVAMDVDLTAGPCGVETPHVSRLP